MPRLKDIFALSRVCAIGLTVAFVLAACSSGGCLENGSTLPLAGIYSISTREGISIDSLKVWGIGAPDDSILVKPKPGISTLYMPFRADYKSVSWVFAICQGSFNSPQWFDTITFDYTTIPYFASAECGAMYAYRVDKVFHTSNLIDSVAIVDSLFTNVDREQIKIYYRTQSEDEDL